MINDLKHYMGGEFLCFLLSPYGPVLCFPVWMIPIQPFWQVIWIFYLKENTENNRLYAVLSFICLIGHLFTVMKSTSN